MSATQYNSIRKIWLGPKNQFHIDNSMSFGQIIFEKLSGSSLDRIVQVSLVKVFATNNCNNLKFCLVKIDGDTGESLTLQQIRIQTIRCAQNLIRLGYTQNDRIAIIARNHHHLTSLVIAALCIGCPIAPLDVIHVKGLFNLFPQESLNNSPDFVF